MRSNATHHAELASAITLRSPAVFSYVQKHGGEVASAAGLNALVDQQAIVLAYADTARVTAAITFMLVPCVLLMRRPKPQAGIAAD